MFSVSEKAFNIAIEKLVRAMMSRPDLLARMAGRGTTSNKELLEVVQGIFPIEDPEIIRVHGEILKSFEQPRVFDDEILNGSRILIHLWQGGLKEEERLSGQKIPRLKRERVDELLPGYFVPPGTAVTLAMPMEELGAIKRLLTTIIEISKPGANDSWVSLARAVFLYPLVVLIRLMNDAAA